MKIVAISLEIKREIQKRGQLRNPRTQLCIPNDGIAEKLQQELNLHILYVAGEGDDLLKYFKHKPRQLNKELLGKAGGQIDKAYMTKGILRIVAGDESQKNKLLKLQYLDNKPVNPQTTMG